MTGIDRHGADVENEQYCYQTKLRQGMPAYLREWLTGIVMSAVCKGKVGVVIWKEPRRRDDDAVVVLRLKDWQDIVGRVKD